MLSKLPEPTDGEPLEWAPDGKLIVPYHPIIPFIDGDGVGPEITAAMQHIVDAAVDRAYGGARKIAWFKIYAGEEALEEYSEHLPRDTIAALEKYLVGIKGPLATPVGGELRSINFTLRNLLDLYQCIRPCAYIPGTPSPAKHPERMNVVIFRENTEDVYNGLEWQEGSDEAEKLRAFLREELNATIPDDAGIGIKEISEYKTKRLVRAAIEYAIKNNLPGVAFMHKGNIMKFTEGNFNKWAYEVALDEYRDQVITEKEVRESVDPDIARGKIVIKDRIADNMLYQVLIAPEEFSVIATPNLNGDYLSDVCAAQIGGLGMAPSANKGDKCALFEAAHGTAPDIAGKGIVNPTSLILSACMMLEHLGWDDASTIIRAAVQKTIEAGTVPSDLAKMLEGATSLSTMEYANAIVENL